MRVGLILAVILIANVSIGGAAAAASNDICPPGHYVVLIPGTGTDGVSNDFDAIKRALVRMDARCHDRFRGFSYIGKYELAYPDAGTGDTQPLDEWEVVPSSLVAHQEVRNCVGDGTPGHKPCQSAKDTAQDPDLTADNLQRLLEDLMQGPDQAKTFDLVGFSLGGLIPVYWAARYRCPGGYCPTNYVIGSDGVVRHPTFPDTVTAVKHIISIDGPLSGRPGARQCNVLPACPKNLVPTWLDPEEKVTSVTRTDVERHIVIDVIRSAQDNVVLFDHATLFDRSGSSGVPFYRDFRFSGGFNEYAGNVPVPHGRDGLCNADPISSILLANPLASPCFLSSHAVMSEAVPATASFIGQQFVSANRTYNGLRGDWSTQTFRETRPIDDSCQSIFAWVGCLFNAIGLKIRRATF